MTIAEIQEKRREVESQILAAINDFHETTGCQITDIGIHKQEVATEAYGAFTTKTIVKATVSL